MIESCIIKPNSALTFLIIIAAIAMLTVSVWAFRGEIHEESYTSRSGLVITKAELIQDQSLLQIEGDNAVGRGFVRISDALHDRLIGNATADNNGRWTLRTVMPAHVPCRVQAESGFMVAARNVTSDRNQMSSCLNAASSILPQF